MGAWRLEGLGGYRAPHVSEGGLGSWVLGRAAVLPHRGETKRQLAQQEGGGESACGVRLVPCAGASAPRQEKTFLLATGEPPASAGGGDRYAFFLGSPPAKAGGSPKREKRRLTHQPASRRLQSAEIKATSTPKAETDSPHHGEPGARAPGDGLRKRHRLPRSRWAYAHGSRLQEPAPGARQPRADARGSPDKNRFVFAWKRSVLCWHASSPLKNASLGGRGSCRAAFFQKIRLVL